MWSLLIIAALVSGQTPDVRLASAGLRGVNVKSDEAAFFSDHLAQELTARGVPIVTQSEIAALIGLERQRELAGCSNDKTSCIGQLANALGADGLVTGSIGRFGKEMQLNVKVVRVRDGKAVAVYSGQIHEGQNPLNELTHAADELAGPLREAFGLIAPGIKVWPAVLPLALGVVGIGVGTGLFVAAAGNDKLLRTAGVNGQPSMLYGDATKVAGAERSQQLWGTVAMAAGGAGLITGVVLGLLSNHPAVAPPPVAVVPSVNGFVVVGSFP
jgi:hypothetical protein